MKHLVDFLSAHKTMVWLLTICFSVASCNFPIAAAPTESANVAFTVSAQAVLLQLTASAIPNTIAPVPTSMSTLTNTPLPPATTAAPTLTSAPIIPATPVCDKATFIRDETVPDGSVYAPGVTIVKTWLLKNVGSCTWTTGYVAFFDHGQSINTSGSTPDPVALPNNVPPGGTVKVTVNFVAPSVPGVYQADFRLRSAKGNVFGIGPSGKGTFWVKIIIPTPTASVTPSYP